MVDLTLRRRFRLARLASTLLSACVYVALIGFAAPAQAQEDQTWQPVQPPQSSKPSRRIHGVPFVTHPQGANPLLGANPQTTDCTASYYGGPVISNVKIVLVYWGNHVSSIVTSGMPGFYQGVTNSPYFDLLSEYHTNIRAHDGRSGTNQSIGRGSFMEADTITPSICDGSTPCSLADNDIRDELFNQIHAGHLPAPQYDSQGNVDTLYMIYFPPDVDISDPNGHPSCAAGGFCAYHGTTFYSSGYLGYGVVPDFGGGCSSGCGAGTEFQNLTSASSHELAESTTDLGVGQATSDAPPLAWYSDTCGEIGDGCNAQDTSITTPDGTYTVQKLWSNAKHACVTSGLHPVYQWTAPAAVNPGTPFNVTLTVHNPTGLTTDISYIGEVKFSSSDSDTGITLPADYTFTSSDQGTSTFSATLKTVGPQSITVTDQVNSAITATAPILVRTATSIAVTNVSPASEILGQNAQVTITAVLSWTGSGTAPTGAVTISGTAPSSTYGTTSCGAPASNTITCTNTYTPTALDAPGLYTMSAAFAGDGNYAGSTSTQTNNFSILQPPTITSANHAVFQTGLSGSFQVTATGFPASMTFSEIGNLPGSVILNSSGLLSGIPAAGTGGVYHITITASNSVPPSATQNFTLTVNQPAAIKSANYTTFTKGMQGSFTITTTGTPTPAITYSPIRSLPAGLSLVDNGNGTATLSGKSTVSGVFSFWIIATNGVGSPTLQSFTLSVKP